MLARSCACGQSGMTSAGPRGDFVLSATQPTLTTTRRSKGSSPTPPGVSWRGSGREGLWLRGSWPKRARALRRRPQNTRACSPSSVKRVTPLGCPRRIPTRVRELERGALRGRLNRAFAIASSHYENISLEALSEDYPGGYEPHELKELQAEATPGSKARCSPRGGDLSFEPARWRTLW